MKIERTSKGDGDEKQLISLELKKRLVAQVDAEAERAELSRRALIEAILEQVLNDKNFVLKL
jgi:metal-responsive CopG/Arc/MetJ family transcriptional regulator